jgi:hypothetical protein
VLAAGGTARDENLAQVSLRLQRLSDGLFWNGTAWTSSSVFVNATGLSSWSYTLPSLSTGAYTITPQARDKAGNLTTGAGVTFVMDTVAPQVSITSPQNGQEFRVTPGVTGTASDAQSRVTLVEVRVQRLSDGLYWNGSAWTSSQTFVRASGTSNWTFALPALSTARYKLTARAYDAADNSGASRGVEFVFDSNPSQ